MGDNENSKIKNFIDSINLDDKDLGIIGLTTIAIILCFVSISPESGEIIKYIASGILGMAIGRKKK